MNEEIFSEEKKKFQKQTFWKKFFAFFVIIPSLVFWGIVLLTVMVVVSFFSDGGEDDTCTVARIPIHGVLTTTSSGFDFLSGFGSVTSADSITDAIQNAEHDDTVEAIVLDIDSPGGFPVSADEILTELINTTKPTVAVIRSMGTSAAYWVAVGADHIIASPVSEVGSIGVTMSYLEYASSTNNEGSRWVDLSSGLFKDAGNPERKLREEEEEYFKLQVDEVHAYMVDRIASVREEISKEDLSALADGRAFLGTEALSKKLIDELGGFNEALVYIRTILSKNEEEVTLCKVYEAGFLDLFY